MLDALVAAGPDRFGRLSLLPLGAASERRRDLAGQIVEEISQKEHFSDGEWVDFLRRQGGQEGIARLDRHLAAGCVSCVRRLRLWRAVLGLTGQETAFRPPGEVVGRVRGHFALHRARGFLERMARSASQVFDSLRQPLPAGVRAAGLPPQQLVYKAGRYLILLRVEPRTDSGRLSVVGQVLDEGTPKKALRDVAVLVLRGRRTVEGTLTNHLGEFQLETGPESNLRLSVGLPEIGPFSVSLPPAGGKAQGWVVRVGAQRWRRRTKTPHEDGATPIRRRG